MQVRETLRRGLDEPEDGMLKLQLARRAGKETVP